MSSKLSEVAHPKSSRSLSVISSSPYSTIRAIFVLVKPDDLWWRRKLKIKIFSEEATSAFKLVFIRVLYHLEMLIFVEGGKAENPEKNPQSKARWEASALATAQSLLPKTYLRYNLNTKFALCFQFGRRTSVLITEYTVRFVQFDVS